MKTVAPGKLIISGEHAVVYQKPAIASTINRFIDVAITPQAQKAVTFDLLGTRKALSFDKLKQLKTRADRQYQLFLAGLCKASTLLHRPEELVQYVVADILTKYNTRLREGFELKLHSTLPMQCGMGSSAASIVGTLLAVMNHLSLPLSREELTHWAISLENYQHGKSSGFDIQTIIEGGFVFRERNNVLPFNSSYQSFYTVNTGRPRSSTGECVSDVKQHFSTSLIWDEFEDATLAIKKSLYEKNFGDLKIAIRENHRLLNAIGVVPTIINQFIQEIETRNAAAKICGAGSVRGDHAGVILIVSDTMDDIALLCLQHGFTLETVMIETQGARRV